jgi:hypothetical protein
MMKYFIAGDKLLAFNAKCCTSSFCRAIIKTHHPEIEEFLQTKVTFPEGVSVETRQLHQHVPSRFNSDRPTALLVREPVSRFRSAIGFLGLSEQVDDVIRIMLEETGESVQNRHGRMLGGQRGFASNIHLLRQSRFIKEDDVDITCFSMPDQIDECAEWLGLPTPLVHVNEASGPKPDLTNDQIDKIKKYYKSDIELWESVNA